MSHRSIKQRSTEFASIFPWYSQLVAESELIPFMVHEALDHFYYGSEPLEGFDSYLTSGSSSGRRRLIYYSAADEERYLNTKARVFGDFVRNLGFDVQRVISDVGTGHAANTAGEVFRRAGLSSVVIQYNRPIQEHIDLLQRARPQLLYTMPSILEKLVTHLQTPAVLGIQGIILVGECAGPQWIANVITGRMGIPASAVMDTYGSIEIGLIAHFSKACGCYVVEEGIIAESVQPAEIGLDVELSADEGILVVTSLIRDAFPAIRFVTYDVVRAFQPAKGGQPATFEAIVKRIGTEFKHGEKISLHDIESVVYQHLSDAVIRVQVEERRIKVLICSNLNNDDTLRKIQTAVECKIPEIGIMINNRILDHCEIIHLPFDKLPVDPSRVKQRLIR